MNNEGFLLYDSMVALLIFTVIVLMLPGLIYISVLDGDSMAQLKFYREQYTLSSRYDFSADYISKAAELFNKAGVPCDERLKKICS